MPEASSGASAMTRGILMVMSAGFCWGTSGTLQAFAPAGATSTTIGVARVVGTGVILLAITFATNPRRFLSGPWRPFPVLLAGFGLTLYQLTFFAAARMAGAGVAAIIAIGSAPAMAGLMGRVLFRERLSRRWCIATVLGVFGGALLVSGGNSQTGAADPTGVLLALAAGFAYALEGVGIKMIGRDREPFDATTAIFLASGLLGFPFLLTPDSAWIFTPHGLVVILLLAGISSALAFTLFTKGLLIVGVAKSYTLALTEPLTAWLLSTFVLGQKLAPIGLAGVAVICGAILFLASELRESAG